MRWSLRLAAIRGIELRIHLTLVMLLIWIGSAAWVEGSPQEALAGVLYAALLFTIVLLHELGHALVAHRFGVRTRDITLLPIGGVARMDHIPEEPRAELLIALAGPAVNVALAVMVAVVLLSTGQPLMPADPGELAAPLLTRLLWINVVLVLFNMIPAFPMDGGRVLRAILALRLGHHRATRIAATLGQALALVLGFVGLFGGPLLVFIALFVWLGAAGETHAEELRCAVKGLRVADVMVRDFAVVSRSDTLASVAARVIGGFQNHFPVLEDGRVAGLLTHQELLLGLGRAGPGAPVAAALADDARTIDASEPLERALELLERASLPALSVVSSGALVGVLTLEGLAELVALRNVVHRSRVDPVVAGLPDGAASHLGV